MTQEEGLAAQLAAAMQESIDAAKLAVLQSLMDAMMCDDAHEMRAKVQSAAAEFQRAWAEARMRHG